MTALFWTCVALLIYIYVGYPLMCAGLAAVMRRWPAQGPATTFRTPRRAPAARRVPVPAAAAGNEMAVAPDAGRGDVDADASAPPRVTVLIAAYNESERIAATVENKLSQDYPRDRLEIIVVSDGSSDGTDEIVAGYAAEGVRLIRQEPRAGKTSALNLAQQQVTGDVIAFSDANSVWARDALRHLVAPLADLAIGYVTGRMVYRAADGSLTGEGCSAYMRYENRLRWWETGIGSVVGVDGGIDVVRRGLYAPMRPDQLPDFVLPLSVRERGYRVVYAPGALLYEDVLTAARDEWRMRVRVALRAWWALKDKARLLNPLRYGLYAWQLLSHKVLRYLAGLFQAGALMANALVVLTGGGVFWSLLLMAQVTFYGLALASAVRRPGAGELPRALGFPYYLCLLNAAALVALGRFLRGEKKVVWRPRT
ncbi:MAG: glycosyltransferase family 2 protein [Candidatus Krumholzibacteriia bacterium]